MYPHGSTDALPFATMGSGSLAAMSVFESRYRQGPTLFVSFPRVEVLLTPPREAIEVGDMMEE